MNISNSWLEAQGQGDDHADIIQCYDPNNSPTAEMNVSHTTDPRLHHRRDRRPVRRGTPTR